MKFPIAESKIEIVPPVAQCSAILRRFLRRGRMGLGPGRDWLRKKQRGECDRTNANRSTYKYKHCVVLLHMIAVFDRGHCS